MKQKISLKDKNIRTPINGKFNDIGSVDLVIKKLIFLIKYLCTNLQNIKINNICHCNAFI
jgi:hypothetical protein